MLMKSPHVHIGDSCEIQDAGGVENSPEIGFDELIFIPFQFIGKIAEMFSICKLQLQDLKNQVQLYYACITKQ